MNMKSSPSKLSELIDTIAHIQHLNELVIIAADLAVEENPVTMSKINVLLSSYTDLSEEYWEKYRKIVSQLSSS